MYNSTVRGGRRVQQEFSWDCIPQPPSEAADQGDLFGPRCPWEPEPSPLEQNIEGDRLRYGSASRPSLP